MAWHRVLVFVLICTLCFNPGRGQNWGECDDDEVGAVFSECQCSHATGHLVALQCVDMGYTNAGMIKEIPFEGLVVHLTNVTITGNNFQELPVNLFGSCAHDTGQTMKHSYLGLEYLDLSNNAIRKIHGKTFHCIQNLQTLVLNDNNLDHPENSARMFSDLEALEVLHLTNAFNFDKEGNGDEVMVMLAAIFDESDLQLLTELHLESNYIGSFSPKLFEKLQDLERLYLSNNYLRNPVLSPKCGSLIGGVELGCRLKEVYLNSNSITQLSAEFMENMDQLKKLSKLDLSDNPFWCDCTFKDSHAWLKAHEAHLVNTYRLVCKGPPSLAGVSVLELDANDMQECVSDVDFAANEETSKASGRSAGNVILIILLVAACCLLVGVIFVKRKPIKEKAKSTLGSYFPRLFSQASGYNTVSNPAATV